MDNSPKGERSMFAGERRAKELTTYFGSLRQDLSRLVGGTSASSSRSEPALDLDHLAGDQVEHALADVGHAVGDALQVVRRPQQVRGPVDRAGVGHHEGQQFAVDLVVQFVHLVVAQSRSLRLPPGRARRRRAGWPPSISRATSAMRGMSISGLSVRLVRRQDE